MAIHREFSPSWDSDPFSYRNGVHGHVSHLPITQHFKSRNALPENHKPRSSEDESLASQGNISRHPSPTRRLLTEARETFVFQLGREATAMDMILDHRLLLTSVVKPPPDRRGRHWSPVSRNHVFNSQADVDAYWAQQGEERKCVTSMAIREVEPNVSAERSTKSWPPNLDGE